MNLWIDATPYPGDRIPSPVYELKAGLLTLYLYRRDGYWFLDCPGFYGRHTLKAPDRAGAQAEAVELMRLAVNDVLKDLT